MQEGIHLFRFRGISVYLHWTWFLVAYYSITTRGKAYPSMAWNIAEYLAVFLFVLLHEFGHAFACRQTGGHAERILLWPLGGVAYVSPPHRPGANLWSIAAGPLVNVALIIPLNLMVFILHNIDTSAANPTTFGFLKTLITINWGLLIFNMLPIYPLDGGQIVQSLLWFILGEARSLLVATIIGFFGALALGAFAIWSGMMWTIFIAGYLLIGNWGGFQRARALLQAQRALAVPGY